ncbi:uncharacterized protein PFL1_05454 [Pseudozyma flocculosa PF-1]|uniref:PH domain-containing protein n=1 Tax=Pseudozyma flocculosa PF-1 TaxID=1277687 RepID=A0A061H3C4_9BASI|nr:uncharacterized protein PFL1_05454 [Pseudozyma flocculosa PF-1]EPQ26819.1 hypothetical protein PFL1_05454 [Pseudozyma flocculosa PF-1]
MDSGSTGEASVDGLFHAGSPPSSPSPAPRGNAPPTPKEGGISASLSFRPPPRPGSSMRKGRKSDFNSPAPPPLPTAFAHEPMPFSDATNFEGYGHPGPSASTPSRPSSSSSADQPGLFNFLASNDSAHRAIDTTRACRQKLQALREENQTQVNSAGLLGAGLLELRNRIEALMDELADELSTAEANADDSHDTGSKIKQLSERIEAEIEEMEYQKGKLYRDVMAHGASELAAADQSIVTATDSPSKAARVASAIKNLTGTTPSKAGGAATPGAPASASAAGAKGTGMPTPRQGDRRSRNAAARQAKADSELINEIQAGLVQEVRRLQGLLKERDDQRGALERTNAELEKQLDLFKPRVIQMTEAEDALKQENWDLEVAKQGLEEQLGERDKLLKKAELETTRLAKDLGKARETIDSQRLELDAHLAELERTKKQRETEVAMARKERAGMQRDVSDLQSELQRYKAQQLSKGGLVSRSVSNSYMTEHDAGDDDDDDAGANDPETLAARLRAAYANEVGNRSPADSAYSDDLGPRSPAVGRLGRDKEAQDLRAKLAMAQKKAGKDAAEKRRVREKNAELKKLLAKAGVKLPAGLDDDDDVETSDDEELQWRDEHGGSDSPSVKRLSASKLRPGKLGKRPSMARRLGMSSSASNDSILERSEELDDELDESTTDGDRTLAKQHAAVGDDSTSTEASPRASLEGYDPAFADVTQAGFGTPATQPKSRRQPGRASAAAAGRGSPLAHAAILADSDEGDAMSPPRSKSRQQGRRSHAAGRPESAVFEPSALGNELENLRGSEDFEDAGSGTLDVDTDEAGEEEEEEVRIAYEEVGVATEPLPDLVGPALEEKEKVAASSAALGEAIASHKAYVEQQELRHTTDRERRDESHAFALSQRDRQHADSIRALEESHASILSQQEAAYQKALEASEEALQKAQAEIGALKATIDDLNARILAAESKSAETESQRKADGEQQAAAIKELEAELASAASTKAEQESQLERFRSDIADLEARLTLTEQRASNVQSERDAASSDAIKKAQADVDALKAAALAAEARLKASEQDAAKQATDLRAELEAGHGQLRDANDKLQQAEQKVRQLEAERSAQETKLAEAVASLGAATAAADQHQKEASTQAAEAGRQKTLLAQLTAAHAELRDQAEEHERLRREADAALVRHQKEAREKQASLESEAAAKHTRLQNEVEATQSRLQRDAAEHARLQQEAQAERDRLQALAEEEGKLRKQAQEEATAASAAAAAATAAAAAAAAEAATAADSTPASATSASPSPGSPVPAGNVESREESDSGHATEAETDVERYEDAVSHMRSLSLERPVPYGMPTAAFRLPAELKESGCQTDDLMWSSFQDDMARTSTPDVIRPMSSMTTTSVRHENAVGQGGVMVLGGHQSSNRPRDSVSTFGGHRDGSMRIESPAPSMYTSARKSLNSRRSAAGNSLRRGPRQSSAASFVSDVTSELSRRFSLASSQASDDAGDETFIARPGGRTRGMSEFGGGEGTDPMVIHAITQTMIGEYMHKYTRKSMGRGGHSDKRHRRYFWVHPYTKMLYWTISDPGGAKVSEGTSKSASITGVRVVEDSNPSPPGLYHESLVIMTASREVKITAPSRERHEAWLGALDYLVNRPAIHDAATVATEVGAGAVTDAGADIENNAAFASRSMGRRSRGTGSQRPSLLTNQRNFLSRKSMDNVGHHPGEGLPRHRQGSVGASSVLYPSAGKRRDLAAREYLQQQERERQMSMSPTSSLRRGATRSIVGGGAGGTLGSQIDPDESYDHLSDLNEPISDPRLQTAEEMLEEDEGEGFEGLDNVRACCDGKHDVGSLAYDHSHHHGPNGGGGGGGSSSGRRSSKRHGRQSSGGSRFSNVLPLNLLPKMGVASSMGIAAPTAAELDAASGPGSQNGHGEMRSVSQPGPSYGERVHKIRQARQSASTLK